MDRMATGAKTIVSSLPEFRPGIYLDLNSDDGSYRAQDYRGDVAVREQRGFTAGFLAGKLWMLSDFFSDESFRRAASDVTRYCEVLAGETEADVGFVSHYGPAMGYEITGEEWMKEQALKGCDSLGETFHPTLGVLMVWPPNGPTPDFVDQVPRRVNDWEAYIDSAASASVFWWARRFAPRYEELIRTEQESMTRLGLIQADGRVYHLLGFDASTSAPVEFHTAQGWNDYSRWTRAQGWGLNSTGFAYEATGEEQSLALPTTKCGKQAELGHTNVLGLIDHDVVVPGVSSIDHHCPGLCKDVGGRD